MITKSCWNGAASGRFSGVGRSVPYAMGVFGNQRELAGNGAEIIPKGVINLGQSLSQPAADSSLCTREPWGRGMRIAASARWASSQLQWFPVIPRSGATWESVLFTMDGGSGRRGRRPLRPAGDGGTARRGRRALRVVAGRSHQLPGQRLAKRKARKEQLVKFGFCPIISECSTAYNVRKPQQSPARVPVGAASTEQNSLEPHPAARQGAPRP